LFDFVERKRPVTLKLNLQKWDLEGRVLC
jgi:hypothetical protein